MKNEYEFLGLTWPVLNHASLCAPQISEGSWRESGQWEWERSVCSKEATLRSCLAPKWVSGSHRRFTDMWLTAGDLFEPSHSVMLFPSHPRAVSLSCTHLTHLVPLLNTKYPKFSSNQMYTKYLKCPSAHKSISSIQMHSKGILKYPKCTKYPKYQMRSKYTVESLYHVLTQVPKCMLWFPVGIWI